MRLRHLLLLTLALTPLTGCSAGTDGPSGEAVLDGTWRGGASSDGVTILAVLTLSEQDSVIAGSGYISGSGLECQVGVDGARTGERIAFDLTCPPYRPIRFRGNRTSATRIFGTIGGSGLPEIDIEFLKQ